MQFNNTIIEDDETEDDEPEDARSQHLLELIRTVKAQAAPAPDATEPASRPAANVANQDKPTLKLTR